jgi:hypothetical protein
MQKKLMVIMKVDFDTFCIRQILEKKWEYNDAVHHHFIALKETYGSVWREVLYV